jgi:YHS domain-containing protein
MNRILTLALFLLTTSTYAQDPYFNKDGIAINGYDPVAFFTENAAVHGTDKYIYKWNGVTWQFKSAENRNTFKSNPEKYVPQFGGYCAYGVSENHKSPTEPEAFTIVKDKLYLNYNMAVRKAWRKDTLERIATGEKNWAVLKDKKD